MSQLIDIVRYLDTYLKISRYQDASLNGLQIESSSRSVRKLAVAVDCGESVIKQAIELKASLLLVHHGLFWGKEQPIRGPLKRKIELFLKNGCSLYAAHLPLDGHPDVGNAVRLAKFLNLTSISPFVEYAGGPIGARGNLKKPLALGEICARLSKMVGFTSMLELPFGRNNISSAGIVTGSGAFAIEEAAELGLDLLISGEPKQSAYHMAKELKLNVVFAGHYATETFGVRVLAQKLEHKFSLKSVFIDEPTGI